jgi:L-rhamnose-H+ transport protein
MYLVSGLLGASFYLPLKGVRGWAWESYWLIYALTALLIVPWALAITFCPNLFPVLKQAEWSALGNCFVFGAMWGVGGLTWGLGIRYLGFGLGLALACGSCAAFGTLLPPLVEGKIPNLLQVTYGQATLAGVGVSLLGIVVVGMAGMSKERELSAEQKKAAVAEFSFKKGAFLAVFAGFMSAGMNFGILGPSGAALQKLVKTTDPTPPEFWEGLPVLLVVLLGGFSVNFLWCVYLNLTKGTAKDYTRVGISLIPNYVLAAIAGGIWYSQMLFYTIGNTKMGESASYSAWTLQMSSQIIFSTLIGLALREWRGASSRTKRLLVAGLFLLILAVFVIGYGKYLFESAKAAGE